MHIRVIAAFICYTLAVGTSTASTAGPRDDVAKLIPFWRANAPLCPQALNGAPSSEQCDDGDMTLFNGLLCASGEQLGCDSVKAAQDESGRWFRSPRIRKVPNLQPTKDVKGNPIDSFSWDMAVGVQLYAVYSGDAPALQRWLEWVEVNRPCEVQTLSANGKKYCPIHGLPRWCTDDTDQHGCVARPQDLATLVVTVDALGVTIPPPVEDKPPKIVDIATAEIAGAIDAGREANAALSLQKLLPSARGLQPGILSADALINGVGFSLHLTAAEILLFRKIHEMTKLPFDTGEIDIAAATILQRQPDNPFFQFLARQPVDTVASTLLSVAPTSVVALPASKSDWAWQRATSEAAWKRSNLWDDVFLGNLLVKPTV